MDDRLISGWAVAGLPLLSIKIGGTLSPNARSAGSGEAVQTAAQAGVAETEIVEREQKGCALLQVILPAGLRIGEAVSQIPRFCSLLLAR